MNCALAWIAVTATTRSSVGCAPIARHAAASMRPTKRPTGSRHHTSTAPTADSMPTALIALRQPNVDAISAPAGMPSTAAIDQPRNTKAIVRARRSGDTSRLAVAAACGVNSVPASDVSTRRTSRIQ